MGEAWFMSFDRKMYTDALSNSVEKLDPEMVNRMFDDIIAGPPCFGQLDEWQNWYHYFLPRLIPMSFKQPGISYVAEWLASATFSQHPAGLQSELLRGFRADVLATLGNVLMAPVIWEDGKLKWEGGLFNESGRHGESWWYLDTTSRPIAAMLFFCVKYLRPDQIGPWFRSAINIDCPLWRSQLIVWLTGAKHLLSGAVTQPSQLCDAETRVEWMWSHVFSGNYTGDFSNESTLVDKGSKSHASGPKAGVTSRCDIPFIPPVNITEFGACYEEVLPKKVREEFAEQVMEVPLLQKEMGAIAAEFIELKLS